MRDYKFLCSLIPRTVKIGNKQRIIICSAINAGINDLESSFHVTTEGKYDTKSNAKFLCNKIH